MIERIAILAADRHLGAPFENEDDPAAYALDPHDRVSVDERRFVDAHIVFIRELAGK